MLTVAVASCLHMDSHYIGKFDPELGIHSNWHEALNQLRKIVNYCNKHDVDFLVLNGDIFHTGRPTPEAVVRVRRELDRLDTTKVIAEPGNHDLQQINASHADPLTAYFAGSRWCETVVTEPSVIDIDGFMLAVMPWFRVSGRSEIDDVSREMADETKRMADEVAVHDGPSLFVGHLTTKSVAEQFDFKSRSELASTNTGLEAVLDEHVLDDGPWDRYCLGHIHKHQKVGNVGKGVYTGSTHRVTFSEEHETKGFSLYTWNEKTGKVSTKFINLGGRQLISVDLSDLSGDPTIDEKRVESLVKRDYFRLTLPYEYALEDMPEKVQDTYYDLLDDGIIVDLRNAAPPKSEKTTTSIPVEEDASPTEMMSAYIDDQEDIGVDKKKRIIEQFREIEERAAS